MMLIIEPGVIDEAFLVDEYFVVLSRTEAVFASRSCLILLSSVGSCLIRNHHLLTSDLSE